MKRRRRGRRERGFTLIELMIALVVSSLLIGMIFAIFIRMSVAYRGQQQVAEVQTKLAAARARIELDAKMAGLHMNHGFHMATLVSGELQRPIRVTAPAGGGPDEVAFYFADPTLAAVTRPVTGTCNKEQCSQIHSTAGFEPDDVVVMSTPVVENDDQFSGEQVVRFEACVFQLQSVGPGTFVFSTSPPWGTPSSSHCLYAPVVGKTVYYKLGVRHWRIDPTRPAEGVLQVSKLGALIGLSDWEDQGYGFTDLQIATQYYEHLDPTPDLPDPDEEPDLDWYSGPDQENLTRPGTLAKFKERTPIQITISLVARTDRDVEGIASAATPKLTITGNENYNTISDRDSILLPSTLPALTGNRIYRYTTFQVDLRNIGVGR
jgi:prepilin-type N-terminal cleavage/methylation domain-containing protein